MNRQIEKLVNGNIAVTIPIRLKYDGHKTVIIQPEKADAELREEDMSPLQRHWYRVFNTAMLWKTAKPLPCRNSHGGKTRNERSCSGHCRWLISPRTFSKPYWTARSCRPLRSPVCGRDFPTTGTSSESSSAWHSKHNPGWHSSRSASWNSVPSDTSFSLRYFFDIS